MFSFYILHASYLVGLTYSYRAITDGPCGSSSSAHLAKSLKDPRVLLLGAGKAHNSVNHCIPGDRFTFASTNAGPQFNYRFKGAPELGPKGRELVYDRGSGLSDSSNINFAVWDYARKGEMDEWVRQVGDNIWNYKSQLQKMKKIENFRDEIAAEYADYVLHNPASHGTDGQTPHTPDL